MFFPFTYGFSTSAIGLPNFLATITKSSVALLGLLVLICIKFKWFLTLVLAILVGCPRERELGDKFDKVYGFVFEDGFLELWPFRMARESVTLIGALTLALGWSQCNSRCHWPEFVAIPTEVGFCRSWTICLPVKLARYPGPPNAYRRRTGPVPTVMSSLPPSSCVTTPCEPSSSQTR